MLIWINGAFGAGKTITAHNLLRRLPAGFVADPELLGIAAHKMLPGQARGDFQDLPQWRSAVTDTLTQADAACDGPVIVPMTIVNDEYFDEVVGGLRAAGLDVRHYALLATAETLRKRLRLRSAYLIGRALGRDETWAIQQIDRCVNALNAPRYARHVPTDHMTTNEVVELIAADAGLELVRPRLSTAREQLYRLQVGVRHIRV